jgi:hypothetical protein
MKTLQLGALGACSPSPCSSLAIIFELVTAWSEQPNKTELGYLCAAAISCSIDKRQLGSNAPAYNPTKSDIKGFGRDCVEYLLKQGVPIPDIYAGGSYLLSQMISQLPSSQGVEEAANFSLAQGADS